MKWAFGLLSASSRSLVADLDVMVSEEKGSFIGEALLVDVNQAMDTLVSHTSL